VACAYPGVLSCTIVCAGWPTFLFMGGPQQGTAYQSAPRQYFFLMPTDGQVCVARAWCVSVSPRQYLSPRSVSHSSLPSAL
jgi:hypothetical protein